MTAFTYTALDANGKEKKGILEGDNARQVRQQLRGKNLTPLSVTEATEKIHKNRFNFHFSWHKKLSAKDLAILTRQLATLLTAGMPVAEALHTVAEQSEKTTTKKIMLGVHSNILEGHSLANGLEKFPHAFPPLYRATVAAGEQAGFLEKVLDRLADFTEKQHYAKRKIQQALIYPILMTLVSITIVAFLLTYVVPRIVHVFSQTSQQLPTATKILLTISHLTATYGIYVLILGAIIIYALRWLLKKNRIMRSKFHNFLLHLPIIGNALKTINTARFARSLGILSAASVPILEAMRVSNNLVNLLPIRHAINNAIFNIREGASISHALGQTKYFPPMSVHLIASGEASGRLEEMLERAATTQDQDVAMLIDSSLTLFEPALIIVMGAIVLFIVLAILLPIFTLDQFTG